jgi:hypothetical protein
MSRIEAIKNARNNVSLYAFGGQYKVAVYDPSVRAWREGYPKDYWQARQNAGAAKIRLAAIAMGRTEQEASDLEFDFRDNGGSWTSYV